MRALFRIAQEEVNKKFPDQKTTVVGGFYFLRFMCPALVVPDTYGLIAQKPSEKSRRSLILLSKVLQNLANSVEFGEKEAYMLKTNPFIMSNQASMYEFLDKLAAVSEEQAISKMKQPNITEDVLEKSLDTITTYLKRLKEKIRKQLGDEKKEFFEQMSSALEEYQTESVTIKETRKKLAPVVIVQNAPERGTSPTPGSVATTNQSNSPSTSHHSRSASNSNIITFVKEPLKAITMRARKKSISPEDEAPPPPVEEMEKIIFDYGREDKKNVVT